MAKAAALSAAKDLGDAKELEELLEASEISPPALRRFQRGKIIEVNVDEKLYCETDPAFFFMGKTDYNHL